MDEVSETIKKNKAIADKFSRIEAELPLFSNPTELFEKLLMRLQDEFAIPYVWLSLINNLEDLGLLRSITASEILRDRLNLINETQFLEVAAQGAKPILANKDLQPFYRLFPKNKKFFIRSIAIAPFMYDGRIIGSINYGDAATTRYEPGMDTSLLQHLTETISSCLTGLLKKNEDTP